MSRLFKILIAYLFILLITNNIAKAQSPYYDQPNYRTAPTYSATERFHKRLNSMFPPSDQDTFGQQLVFGSFELLAYYRLNGILSHADKQTIESVRLQLSALEDNTKIEGYVRDMSERERAAKIASLKRKLRSLEGGIVNRIGRGTARFVIRATQLYLILSVGSRIFVLTTMDAKDPAFFPLPKIACSAIDCDLITERILATGRSP